MIGAACNDTHTAADTTPLAQPHHQENDSCDVKWSYEGNSGPEQWASLSPCYAACAGKSQSPINLTGATAIALDRLEPGYHEAPGTAFDTGHSIEVDIQGGTLTIGEHEYDLIQFHFHTPSEHVVDGAARAAEIHLVHADADSNVAVLGLLVVAGDENAFMNTLTPYLPRQDSAGKRVALDLTDLLPDSLDYFTYDGSLTTPRCSQGLRWLVLKTPVMFSEAQLTLLKSYFPKGNARPPQPLNDREIYVSQDGA